MNSENRNPLLAERTFLLRELAETPEIARLTRMSMGARLRQIEARLSELTAEAATAEELQHAMAGQSPGAQ